MANADVSLLFGVAGEGSLSGESGKLIQEQLTQIMSELNKNPLKVKVGIDTNTGGKKSWSGQLQEKLDQISASGKFSAQISTLKLSAGAVSDFKKQLTAIVNTVGLSTGTQITITAEGLGEVKNKLKEAQDDIKKTGDTATDAAKKIAEFKVQMEALSGQKNTLKRSIDNLGKSATTDEEKAQLAEITAQYEQWAIKIEEVRAAKSAIPADQRATIEAEGAAIRANIDRLNEERTARENAARAAAEAADRTLEANAKETASQAQKNTALKAGINLLTQMEKAEREWTAAQTGSSRQSYIGLQSDIEKLREYKRQLESGEVSVEEFRKKLNELQASFSANSNAIKAAGENMGNLSTRLGNLAQKFSAWLSVSQVIMLGIRSIRRMVSATIELDDAMAQLKIVTQDTSQAYEEYLGKITQIATKIGAAVPDLIDSTTTFARLGYSLNESTALAEFTAMLQNVGDIDVSDAQDAITAIIKAFGISVDEIESVMDKLVITGNNFPISVSQIAEGMNNASSALAAAGNTFEQSVALLTAANTTVQNAAKASTGLRTIAARIRSTKTELDELGETMTEAQYGELVAALSKYNVALTDMNGEFRSTYDIIADIAAIWDDLTSMEQSGLASTLAGTRQQAIFFSMIEQFKEASGAMEDMANSAGTLRNSYATFMDSITAHINQFKAAFQSLSQTTFSSDFLNGFIDLGTNLLKIIELVVKAINVIGGLNTVLYVTVGTIATIKANSILGWIGKLFTPLKNLIALIEAVNLGTAKTSVTGHGMGKTLSVAFGEVTLSATAAQLAVGALVAVLGVGLLVYNNYKRSVEEARQNNIASANAAKDLTNEISNLSNQYIELSEAVKTNGDAKDDLISVQDELISKLGIEKEALQELVDEYGNLSDAIKAATVESLQNAERDLRGGLNAYIESALSAASPTLLASKSMNHITATWSKANAEANRRGLDALANAGYISSGSYSSRGMELYLPSDGDFDLSTIEGIINAHERLGEMMDLVADKAGSENEVYDALYTAYNNCSDAIKDYTDAIGALNNNLAQQYMLQELIGREVPNTKEEFDAFRQSVIDAATESGDFIGSNMDIASAVDNVLSKQTQFASFYSQQLSQASNETATYAAQLSKLTDVISGLKSAYDALEAAQSDMASGGLSPDTITKLANVEEGYLDYLYEENGIIKLNTEAWKENANAKMQSEMAEIQKEIDSIEEENAALEKLIATYEEKRLAALGKQDLTAYYDYYHVIEDTNAKIEENNAIIAKNQGLLSLYGGIYSSITGDLDAYTAALSNFSHISSTVDSISNSFQTLADLQAQVAKGFTMSLEKALEFAAVYPEILNSAQVSANGQIVLNENVVNSFLKGKKAELDAQVETQIAQLEADKAVLQAKMESAKAQLELAQNVGEGEGQIAKELAEYRINAGNAVAEAMIDASVDEATAFKLAAAAMAQNAEEFDRVAMEVCTDVNGNFNQAAYDLAQTMYNNLTNVKTDLASVAKQAHETAKAIAGIADGSVSGSSAIQGGSGGGTGGRGIKLNLTSGSFEGTEYTYTAKESGLDDFISKIELDISTYQDAIAQIDGQIAVLKSLKNLPLESFKSNNGKSSSAKEVEEYVASIEDFREAIERLNRVQQTRLDLESKLANNKDLLSQIETQKQLLEVYKEEQDALHNLNELRDSSISDGAKTLRQLGFNVEYNADNNIFYVKNLEHLNDLVAENKGSYKSLQEATNALRQDTEGLINSLTDLNAKNKENSEAWWELYYAMREAQIAVYENTRQERENAITLTENWFDDAIAKRDLEQVKRFSDDIVSYYKSMQETIKQEADYYRSIGYSDTSDEVSKLSDLWWDYADNITAVKQKVVDNLIEIVDTAHEAVDEIQNVLSTLKSAADEYADNGGFITVDTLQEIIKLGPEYMQYLEDENGLLVINEENINKVIAAKTQQLALENALSYVERLRLALEEGSIENLNQLLFATTDATDATWGLVYANLALLDLDENQYKAALHNINSIRALADNTVENIGKVTGAAADAAKEAAEAARKELEALRNELNEMKSAGDDIIKYVMEMLKHRIQQQIKALEDMKDAYSEIIRLKKESLKASKAENDYQKSVAAKVKEMAELQAKMDALALDNSRDAQAERASLAEQLAELQEDLADKQADYALDATMDSLDKMEEAYHKEKDKEIEILEESISSYQKLYDMAIEYISTHWDTLYSELIAWNTEYGSVLNSEITDAWNNCLAAAERYGSFVDAMLGGIEADIARINAEIESINLSSSGGGSYGTTSSGSSASNNTVVGSSRDYESDYTTGYAAKISDLVAQMRSNSSKWFSASEEEKNRLHQDSIDKANMISRLGVTASYDPGKGVWTITSDKWNPSNVGRNLLSSYHTGGFAGVQPTLKQNEIMAVLEKGEAILDAKKEQALYRLIDFATVLSDRMAKMLNSSDTPPIAGGIYNGMGVPDKDTLSNITNNEQIKVEFGDMYIYGADEQTVEQHREVNRKFANDILEQLKIKR